MVYLVEEIIHVFTDRYVTNKTAEQNRVNSSKGQDSRDEETNEKKQVTINTLSTQKYLNILISRFTVEYKEKGG